jgi:hypothetical protein
VWIGLKAVPVSAHRLHQPRHTGPPVPVGVHNSLERHTCTLSMYLAPAQHKPAGTWFACNHQVKGGVWNQPVLITLHMLLLCRLLMPATTQCTPCSTQTTPLQTLSQVSAATLPITIIKLPLCLLMLDVCTAKRNTQPCLYGVPAL